MFSGIVETIGIIKQVQGGVGSVQLLIEPVMPFDDLKIGDSVAVNGTCLTVTEFTDKSFSVTVVPQTLRLTSLGDLIEDGRVNLERSLRYNARIGGHMVQGHIDGIGSIIDIKEDGRDAIIVRILLPVDLAKYVLNKGYIALDGMSITVIEAGSSYLTVTFIPHTQEVTIVNDYKIGTKINIEVDILGKYIEKLLG